MSLKAGKLLPESLMTFATTTIIAPTLSSPPVGSLDAEMNHDLPISNVSLSVRALSEDAGDIVSPNKLR